MNYKEKYEEALERAKGLLEGMNEGDYFASNEDIKNIFPELKESEDERIRKAILQFFELQDDNTTYYLVPKKDIIAWLEKQGEQKPFPKQLDADKVIEWLNEYVANFWESPCNPNRVVYQFKKDFGL